MAGQLPVVYENPRFDAATPTLKPVSDRAMRAGLAVMLEWGTLTLIVDSSVFLKWATVIVTVLGLSVHESWPWLRMRDRRLYPALMSALVAIYVGLAGYAVWSGPRPPSEVRATKSSVEEAPTGSLPTGGIPQAEHFIAQPLIEWDGKGQILFKARIDRSGEKLPIYLDWGSMLLGKGIVWSMIVATSPRIKIGFLEKFAAGQILSVPIGTPHQLDNGQQMLKLGESGKDNPDVPISFLPYHAQIVIIHPDGKEERYPFLLIPRSQAGKTPPLPPAIVGPQVFEMIMR